MDDRTLSLRGPIRVPDYDLDETIDDFTNFDDSNAWLINEVCTYLFSDLPDEEATERIQRFDAVMDAERERVVDNAPGDDEVVMCVVEIAGCDALTTRECPSAALLLELCASNADIDDDVIVTIVYGDSSRTVTSLIWPFPMTAAVEATTAVRLEDVDDTDEDEDAPRRKPVFRRPYDQDEGGRALTVVIDTRLLRPLARIAGALAAGAVGGLLARRRR